VPDGVRRASAIVEQLSPGRIAGRDHILTEGGQQVAQRLQRKAVLPHRSGKRGEWGSRVRLPVCDTVERGFIAVQFPQPLFRRGIAFVGGVVGCIAVLPVNGVTTGTINWQTFSHLNFAFRITPDLLTLGLGFALFMGAVGGLPPAIRASRANVATTLRAL